MQQIDAIRHLANAAHNDGALIVSDIGSQTVWLHATGDHESHLYLSGPMGMSTSVALGVALANPHLPVLALSGDGGMAMNFGALVTASHVAPKNLTIAVLNNGVYDYTGKLTSPSSTINWPKLISGLNGFVDCAEVDLSTPCAFSADGGLKFLHCNVDPAKESAPPFPFTPIEIHARFKKYVGELR